MRNISLAAIAAALSLFAACATVKPVARVALTRVVHKSAPPTEQQSMLPRGHVLALIYDDGAQSFGFDPNSLTHNGRMIRFLAWHGYAKPITEPYTHKKVQAETGQLEVNCPRGMYEVRSEVEYGPAIARNIPGPIVHFSVKVDGNGRKLNVWHPIEWATPIIRQMGKMVCNPKLLPHVPEIPKVGSSV